MILRVAAHVAARQRRAGDADRLQRDVTFPETRSSQSRIKWLFPDIFLTWPNSCRVRPSGRHLARTAANFVG
ncbi:hypothetical protein [Burkholderia ubonensis]|uniref:hypothetical protein n=1 Tax=Burkholderia ubonensis TaxID=101571 RepID=UPI000AE74189|nr:hypothetical protein [Burkholderia ubonensis]